MAVDFATVLGAFGLFYFFAASYGISVAPNDTLPTVFFAYGVVFALLILIVYEHLELYESSAGMLFLRELERSVQGSALAVAFISVPFLWLEPPAPSTTALAFACGTAVVLLVVERRLMATLIPTLGPARAAPRGVLIYGTGELGQRVMTQIARSTHRPRIVLGFVDDFALQGQEMRCRLNQMGGQVFTARVLGHTDDLPEIIDETEANELLITDPYLDPDRLSRLSELCRRHDVELGVVAKGAHTGAHQVRAEELGALTVLRPYLGKPGPVYAIGKEVFDRVVSMACLVGMLPLWGVIAVAIWLDSGRPILFRHRRVGRGGEEFVLLKFRTLRKSTESYSVSTTMKDPRATRIGRLLRQTGLDELPQLVNVLKGEMSLVGPRPEMPFLVDEYGPVERQRLDVKPGITGIWQLSADREGAHIHDNIEYDLYYLRHRSLLFDAVIFAETVTLGVRAGIRLMARLVSGRHMFRGRNEETEVPTSSATTEDPVVVALDQRRRDHAPTTWRKELAMVQEYLDRGPVKVVAAETNLPLFTEGLEDAIPEEIRATADLELVRHRDRGMLSQLLEGAGLVVTDLPEVVKVARNVGVPVNWVGTKERYTPKGQHRIPRREDQAAGPRGTVLGDGRDVGLDRS